jgi:hypothetical protein
VRHLPYVTGDAEVRQGPGLSGAAAIGAGQRGSARGLGERQPAVPAEKLPAFRETLLAQGYPH